MKKTNLFLLLLFALISQFSWAQCPNLLSAMVNSCGASEGNNEFVVFSTSVTANASTYTLNYGSTNPPTVNNLAGSDATTPTGTGTVTTNGNCPIIQVTSPSTSIPSGSIVVFIPASYDQNYNFSSICNGTAPIYVVFIKINAAGGSNSNWNTVGTLSNSSTAPRYLQVTYSGNTGCNGSNAPVQSYIASPNWPANTDGNLLYWNNSTTHYVNNGCTDISFNLSGDTTAVACNSFTWYGITYTSSTNTPTHTIVNASGVDSVVTLHLTINNSTYNTENQTACGTYSWHGTTYNTSGIYLYNYTNGNGCSSTDTLHLTINNATHNTENQSACGTYTWHGTIYNTSGVYLYNYTNGNGCSSTDTLHLTINNGTHNTESQTACLTYTWHGTTYNTSGVYLYNYTNGNGCISTDTLHLIINTATQNTENQTACGTYIWHGTSYNVSGVYLYNYTNNNGCSSTDTLHLTINNATHNSESQTACLTYTWHGTSYNTTGVYLYNYTNGNGCSSTDTLHLTINNGTHNTENQSSCGTYIWHGTNYNITGVYLYNYTNNNGCSSTDTLHLTINTSTHNTENQFACAMYTWHGTSYNTTGVYLYNYTNGNGCSSTDTLHLIVNQISRGDTSAIVCGSYNWYGINYSVSANPTHIFTNANGCDSIVTLHLTINRPDTTITRRTECISNLPIVWNGISIARAGVYFKSFTLINRCDSIAELILTVNNNSTSNATISVCSNELPYRWNNQILNQSGTYQFHTTNSNGCDSTVTLIFKVFNNCEDILFSNAFTPNNDGLNDSWGPIGNLALINNYQLFVYNRYGESIFVSYNPLEKWNGYFKGKLLDSGNYVWIVSYLFKGVSRMKKGNILLIK